MTNQTNYKPCRFKCNGATKDFPFGFQVHKNNELFVKLINTQTQNTAILTEGAQYSVKLNEVGGNVTTIAAYSNIYEIELFRKTSHFQEKSFSTSSGFQSSEVENGFDRVSCSLQDMDYNIESFKENYSAEINQKVEANKQEMLSLQNDFEEHINTTFADVNNAAAKLNELETSVATAVDAASSATSANQNAQTAAQEAQAAATSANQNAQTAAQAAAQQAANKVTKTGDTMTGALAIKMVTPHQVFKSTNMTINDSTASTVAYIAFYDKNDNPFGSIGLVHQPSIGNYFIINPRDESGVAMTQPFIAGRGSVGDFCSIPMATTTPTTTSTARPNLISAVVANYHNSNSWYIKLSDGFIMQGGYGSGGDTLNGAQLAFATPFSTATYSFQATILTVTTASTFVRSSNKTTSSINVTTGYLNGSSVVFNPYGFNWQACGY